MTMFLKLTGSYIEAEVTGKYVNRYVYLNIIKFRENVFPSKFLKLEVELFVVSMIENTQILFLESKGELEKKQKTIF